MSDATQPQLLCATWAQTNNKPKGSPVITYRFEIEHRPAGAVRVTCGIYEARDERALARKMVNGGCPDGAIEAGRSGKIDYRVRSLHAFAATALTEGDRGLYVAVYSPHPEAEVTHALQIAISGVVEGRKNRVSRAAGVVGAEGGVSQPLAEAAI
jgi:hypothetical protein